MVQCNDEMSKETLRNEMSKGKMLKSKMFGTSKSDDRMSKRKGMLNSRNSKSTKKISRNLETSNSFYKSARATERKEWTNKNEQ